MRPNSEGWWWSPEGEVVEICGVDDDSVQIWRDGELELHEEVGEGWLPVPTRQQHEVMLRELGRGFRHGGKRV